jgi:hypothetical protein
MKFHRGCDVSPDSSGLVCRESRLGGLLFTLIFSAAFVGPTTFFWMRGDWLFFVVLGLASLLLVPLLIGDVLLRLRRTNWTLWAPPGKLLVNLRSYQDRSPPDALSVVELADHEVVEMRRHEDRYTVPQGRGRRTSYKLVSLEIVLSTADAGTLAGLIADRRTAKQPWRNLAGIRSRSNLTLYNVSLPEAEVLRIAWTGGRNHAISPGVNRVLRELESRIHVGEPVISQDGTSELTKDAQIDDRVLSLLQAGNKIDAIKILCEQRGYSLIEAKQFVDELGERA